MIEDQVDDRRVVAAEPAPALRSGTATAAATDHGASARTAARPAPSSGRRPSGPGAYRRRIGRLRGSRLAGRALTFADQAISSASNMLLAVAVATSVDAGAFGRFAILYSIYWLLLGGTRAAVLDPLLITQRNILKDAPVALIAPVSALMIGALGVPVGLLLLATPLGGGWAVFFLGLPFLLLQDALRYVCFLRKRPGAAVLLDGTWLVVMGIAILIAVGGPGTDPVTIIAGWVVGALVSSGVGLAVLRIRLRRIGVQRHLRAIWPVAGPLVGDFGLTSAASQLLVFLLPLVASTALLGSLKAAQVANGPLNVATAAASVICLPLVAAAADSGAGRAAVLRIGRLASTGLGVTALVYGSLLVLMPERVGHALFGPSWGSGLLVAAVSLQQVAIGLMMGALLVLRGSRNTRTILLVRSVLTPVNLLLPLGLTAAWGLAGLSAGLLASTAATALIWWVVAARSPVDASSRSASDPLPASAVTGQELLDPPGPATP